MSEEEFTGIEAKPRYKTYPILGRDIDFIIRYTFEQDGYLTKQVDTLVNLKLDRNATDSTVARYEAIAKQLIDVITKHKDDAEFLKAAIRPTDLETEDFITPSDFLKLFTAVQKASDNATEEETGKASSGSEAS